MKIGFFYFTSTNPCWDRATFRCVTQTEDGKGLSVWSQELLLCLLMKNMKNEIPVIAINFFFEACFHPAFSKSPREYVTLNWFFGTLSFLFKFLGFQYCFLIGFCSKREWYILLASFPDILTLNFFKHVSFATICEETSFVIFEDKVCLYSTL